MHGAHIHSFAPAKLELASEGCVGDSIDEDAHAVGLQVPGHRRPGWQHDDVGVGLVLENDLPGLLDGLPHHLWPRLLPRITGKASGACDVRGAHRRSSRLQNNLPSYQYLEKMVHSITALHRKRNRSVYREVAPKLKLI